MQSTSIFLLAIGLLATVAMARPGRRPWPGHHHHANNDNDLSEEQNGDRWATYRLPQQIRLPALLAGRLGRPWPTYTAKKIFDGKYLVVSPALVFKLKDVDGETSTTSFAESTTPRPIGSTTEAPESTTPDLSEESTTPEFSEESTTDATEFQTTSAEEIDEESITTDEPEEEESTTSRPSFFKKRSFGLKNNEQLFFLEK